MNTPTAIYGHRSRTRRALGVLTAASGVFAFTVGTGNGADAAPVPPAKSTTYVGFLLTSAHVQEQGWLNYVQEGYEAGTTGQSRRLEALAFQYSADTVFEAGIKCQAHVQDYGWMKSVYKPTQSNPCGTVGQSRRLEAVRLRAVDKWGNQLRLEHLAYRCHIQNRGWSNWVYDGEQCGTVGVGLRLEAIKVFRFFGTAV